jgi:HEAT repeat protein
MAGLSPAFLDKFNAGDETSQVEALREFRTSNTVVGVVARILGWLKGDTSLNEIVNFLKSVLSDTKSPRVRNAAALALADLHIPSTRTIILEVLKRPDTKGARGTLLYALDEMQAKVPLLVLIGLILEDDYEAREEALGLLLKNRAEFSGNELYEALRQLEMALLNIGDDSERKDAVKAAREHLDKATPVALHARVDVVRGGGTS